MRPVYPCPRQQGRTLGSPGKGAVTDFRRRYRGQGHGGEGEMSAEEAVADGAEGAEAVAAKPKSRRKLLIIVAAAVLVLVAGGGAGAYMFFFGKAKPADEQQMALDDQPTPVFYDMPEIVVRLDG